MIRHGVNRLNPTGKRGQIFLIEETLRHPKYTGRAYYDIAILKIAPVKFGPQLIPICLPEPSNFKIDRYDDRTATLIGWGSTDLNGVTSSILKKTILTIYHNR